MEIELQDPQCHGWLAHLRSSGWQSQSGYRPLRPPSRLAQGPGRLPRCLPVVWAHERGCFNLLFFHTAESDAPPRWQVTGLMCCQASSWIHIAPRWPLLPFTLSTTCQLAVQYYAEVFGLCFRGQPGCANFRGVHFGTSYLLVKRMKSILYALILSSTFSAHSHTSLSVDSIMVLRVDGQTPVIIMPMS